MNLLMMMSLIIMYLCASATGSLNWMVRQMSELETNVVAVERTKEYSDPKNNEVRRMQEEGGGAAWGNLSVKIMIQGKGISEMRD